MKKLPLLVSLCASLLVVGGVLMSCASPAPSPTTDLTYDTSPDTLVIEANARTRAGPPLPCEECNHIPYLRVWGDGRVIRADYQDMQRHVWSGQISPSRIQQMLATLRDEGFFTPWAPEPGNPAGTWTRITVNLSGARSYTGNPDFPFLNRLVDQVDVSELEPYVPERALLVAGSFGTCSAKDLPEWPTRFGFSLAEAQRQGKWIEGEVLAFTWQEVNARYWQKIDDRHHQVTAFCENGQAWCVSVQVPGVSAQEPPYGCPGYGYREPTSTPVAPQTITPYAYPPTAAGTPSPSANPHVGISASATTLQVGDVVTITSQVVSIRFPRFELYLGDRPVVTAMHNGEVQASSHQGENANPVLEFVSAEGTTNQARFVLRARGAGTVQASVFATGEMYYSGQVTWASLWSDPLPITVNQ